MTQDDGFLRLTPRLVDTLYTEALLLVDESRAYFEVVGLGDREQLQPIDRVRYACESLKVTTRLMHVIAWLLSRRAVEKGEIRRLQARAIERTLGTASPTDEFDIAALPEPAQLIVRASIDLHDRVHRLDQGEYAPVPMVVMTGPARGLHHRLERALN